MANASGKIWANTNTDAILAKSCRLVLVGDPSAFTAVTGATVKDTVHGGEWTVVSAVKKKNDSRLILHLQCTKAPTTTLKGGVGDPPDGGSLTITLTPPAPPPPPVDPVPVTYVSVP